MTCFRVCHGKMSLNSIYTSNKMGFLEAHHGKITLNSIYTSNYIIFRGASLENVMNSMYVHIKLHVYFFFFFWGGGWGGGRRVTGKCH